MTVDLYTVLVITEYSSASGQASSICTCCHQKAVDERVSVKRIDKAEQNQGTV